MPRKNQKRKNTNNSQPSGRRKGKPIKFNQNELEDERKRHLDIESIENDALNTDDTIQNDCNDISVEHHFSQKSINNVTNIEEVDNGTMMNEIPQTDFSTIGQPSNSDANIDSMFYKYFSFISLSISFINFFLLRVWHIWWRFSKNKNNFFAFIAAISILFLYFVIKKNNI